MAPLTLLLVSAADSDPPRPLDYVCFRAIGPILVDGRLDEASWRAVPWTADFQDIEGYVRSRPRFRTKAKMTWDDSYFYIGAKLEEPHVWGTLTEHDSVIFQDNDFEVFLDPDGDNHEYYEIEINALNTEWDLFLLKPYRDGGPPRNEWEIPGLLKAVHIDGTLNDPRDLDRGWSVEVAIPWEVLREYAHRPSPPRDGDQWRVNFSRVEWDITVKDGTYQKIPNKREDNWVWSPQWAIDMHRPELWGFVQFSTRSPGQDSCLPDETWPARMLLMRVYHAQKLYFAKHNRWAERLEELRLQDDFLGDPRARSLTMRPTADGYEASVEVELPRREGPRRCHVRQDSRLWLD
jgi:hypothetical protein